MQPLIRVSNGIIILESYKSTPAFLNNIDGKDMFSFIRIYRKEESEFVFGDDYAEYFDGLSWQNAELIFKGPLSADNNRKFIYKDRNVDIGKVYAYWIAAAEGEPTGPVAVKVRDPKIWWSENKVNAKIYQLAARYSKLVEIISIGHTVQGRDIKALLIGRCDKQAIGLVGSIHPGESGAELILPAIEGILKHHLELLEYTGIVAMPVVNIDNRQKLVDGVPWYLRRNANGVDLNRNFPANWEDVSFGYGLNSSEYGSPTYRGPQSASEPETRAVMECFSKNPVNVLFSFHALASICGMHLLAPTQGKDNTVYKKQSEKFAMEYCNGLSGNMPFTKNQIISFDTTAGSLPAWFYDNGRIPAFDIEISATLEPIVIEQCRGDNITYKTLKDYQQRHLCALVNIMKMLHK